MTISEFKRCCLVILSLLGGWLIPALPASGTSFQSLHPPPELSFPYQFSFAWDISGDGSTVVGRAFSITGDHAVRWTLSTGGMLEEIVLCGAIGIGECFAEARGVSHDGSVIVGQDGNIAGPMFPPPTEAWRWTSATGRVGLGGVVSDARDVNGDGSVVVGVATFPAGSQAFRWTSATGMVELGDLPGGDFSSQASGVSTDGTVIVGEGASDNGGEAFRWTSATGMVGLGDLAGGPFSSTAHGVSADGKIIVGEGHSTNGPEAFQWTTANGMVGLGDLPGGAFSSLAYDVSADGHIVVGEGTTASGAEAFIWDSTNGMRSLQEVLTNDFGIDLAGWQLLRARGVSDDGLTIVGDAFNPSGERQFGGPLGRTEAWVVHLDPSNVAPTVDAGSSQHITLPSTASLDGTVSDDGLPNPPGSLTTTWSKVSGPGTVTFNNASSVDTNASFSLPGTYVLRLTADDSALTSSAEVTITGNPQSVITVPDIRGTWTRGPSSWTQTGCQDPDDNGDFFDPGGDSFSITDQTGANFSFTEVVSESFGPFTFGSTQTCSGTVSSGGTVGASCSYVVTFDGEFWYSGIDTLTGSLAGNTWTYTGAGQDLVGDTCQYNYSTATATRSGPVPPPIVLATNQMPSVSAGADQTIAFPNFAFLDGTVTDDGLPSGTVITTWTKVSGPGTVTFTNPNVVDTTATFSQAGTYVLHLTADDGVLQAFDELSITVTAATPGEPTLYDLNGDGKADIVWRNTNNGAVAAWLMSGLALGPTGILAGVPKNWIIAGIGDVDGDEKADIVWRDTDTGDVAVWLGNGVNPPTTTGVIVTALPLDWKIVGVGDVNGDGTADIILRNTNTGDVAVWLGNGVNPPTTTGVIVTALPADWKIVGVGDVNGDGTADIILRDTDTGDVAVWLGNGVNPPTTTGVIVTALPAEWKIVGVGDVNGDGTADIILRNTSTGDVAVWLGNGVSAPTTTGIIASGVPLDWTIAEISDVDGDDTADIILRNTSTGDVAVWLGNGVNPPTTTGVIADGVPLEWEIQPFEFQPDEIGDPFT